MLSSTRSPHVARLRRLHERKGRQQSGTFLAEGPDCVVAAIESGLVREIVARPDHELLQVAQARGIDVHPAQDHVVSAICETKTSQGIVAECTIPDFAVLDVVTRTGPVVVCDRLADPGNLGTIVRTAEAVGAAGVIVTSGSVDAWNPKAVRASAGSCFRVPIAQADSALAAVRELQHAGRFVLGLSADADLSVFEALERGSAEGRDPGSFAWVVGSEAHGVSDDALRAVDERVSIPMHARVESLNAAISVAVCLYLAVSRYRSTQR